MLSFKYFSPKQFCAQKFGSMLGNTSNFNEYNLLQNGYHFGWYTRNCDVCLSCIYEQLFHVDMFYCRQGPGKLYIYNNVRLLLCLFPLCSASTYITWVYYPSFVVLIKGPMYSATLHVFSRAIILQFVSDLKLLFGGIMHFPKHYKECFVVIGRGTILHVY